MCSVLMWADVSRNEIYWPEMKCNVYIQEERRKDEIWFVLFWDEMQWNVQIILYSVLWGVTMWPELMRKELEWNVMYQTHH